MKPSRMGGVSSTGDSYRQANPQEVVGIARRHRQRLGRHLDALEAGEVGAVDDLAAVLRTLLAHGKGDDVIARLCKLKSIPLPEITLSEPVADCQSIGLAFGAVPALSGGDEPVRVVDIDAWRGLKALIVRGAPRRVSTWEQVIKDYANSIRRRRSSNEGKNDPARSLGIRTSISPAMVDTDLGRRPLRYVPRSADRW